MGYSTTADYRRVVVTVKVLLVEAMRVWRCGGTATLILDLYTTFPRGGGVETCTYGIGKCLALMAGQEPLEMKNIFDCRELHKKIVKIVTWVCMVQ